MTPAATRILIADDHALIRDMLADRVADDSVFEVVGAVNTADEAVDVARTALPDVVLLDIDMPGLDAFDGARLIQQAVPNVRIVFLSAFTHDRFIDQALAVGAMGYVTKREPPENILSAVHEVAEDRAYFSDEVKGRIVLDQGQARLAMPTQSRLSRLTPRELDVLRYIARGFSKRSIAEKLDISLKTVEKHAENLMARLEIHDRVELTRFAIREKLVEP